MFYSTELGSIIDIQQTKQCVEKWSAVSIFADLLIYADTVNDKIWSISKKRRKHQRDRKNVIENYKMINLFIFPAIATHNLNFHLICFSIVWLPSEENWPDRKMNGKINKIGKKYQNGNALSVLKPKAIHCNHW